VRIWISPNTENVQKIPFCYDVSQFSIMVINRTVMNRPNQVCPLVLSYPAMKRWYHFGFMIVAIFSDVWYYVAFFCMYYTTQTHPSLVLFPSLLHSTLAISVICEKNEQAKISKYKWANIDVWPPQNSSCQKDQIRTN
jgi:hypothetical protein